ncbi:hypothetical protein [Rhizobium sp. BK661]|uniref:hypothetical protein n=1 Tax=Rhizobium sp. BK661 TaxID=2586991 RepID=UPI002167B660|nr:hypothetical protein [Rhizobium sp. BK661]MCS3738239.1 hypothetical protein [Rhizobium sp. BK661]
MGVMLNNLYYVGHRWKFRKVIPAKLRPHVEGQITEFVRWLGSGQKNDPVILKKCAEAARECEALLDLARKRAAGHFDDLTAELIAHIIKSERHRLLAEDEENRFDPHEDHFFEEVRRQVAGVTGVEFNDDPDRRWSQRQETHEMLLKAYREDYARGRISDVVRDELEEVCLAHGLYVDIRSDGYGRLARAYLSLVIENSVASLKRQAGEPVPTPDPPPPASAVQQKSAPAEAQGLTIREMAEKKLDMNKKGHSTTEATETALRLFESVSEGKPMASITRREVAEWILLLQQKPVRPDKEHRQLGLRELVAAYADRLTVPRLSGKSVNGHVSHLNSIWAWARKRGHVDRSLDNPFSDQRVEERLPAADEGFTASQLQAIFDLPVFTRGERPTQGRGEAAFWLPLLLLTYGNRPEEMCQLLVGDVFFDDEEDQWCLRITDEGVHPVKGARHIKADGNPVIRRTLPITKTLLDLGFTHYVEALKKSGQVALFPKLTMKGKRGYLHASFATWWGKYLREHGAIPETGNKPLRGFRDAWTTAAARSGLTEEEREWIQGHYVSKGKTSNRRYGVRDFGSKIDDITYKGLDLSKVKGWQY